MINVTLVVHAFHTLLSLLRLFYSCSLMHPLLWAVPMKRYIKYYAKYFHNFSRTHLCAITHIFYSSAYLSIHTMLFATGCQSEFKEYQIVRLSHAWYVTRVTQENPPTQWTPPVLYPRNKRHLVREAKSNWLQLLAELRNSLALKDSIRPVKCALCKATFPSWE